MRFFFTGIALSLSVICVVGCSRQVEKTQNGEGQREPHTTQTDQKILQPDNNQTGVQNQPSAQVGCPSKDDSEHAAMQKDKGSWAKVGIYCSIFCMLTGSVYGLLYNTGCPSTPIGMGVMVFTCVLSWYLLGFLLWAIVRKRFVKLALTLFLTGFLASEVAIGLVINFASVAYPTIHK